MSIRKAKLTVNAHLKHNTPLKRTCTVCSISGINTQTNLGVSCGSPARKLGKLLSRMASRRNGVRHQVSHSRKQQTARPHSVHWWLSHLRPVRVVLHCQTRPSSMKTVQPIRSQPLACQWLWKQSPMLFAGLPQEVTVGSHMPSSSQIQRA